MFVSNGSDVLSRYPKKRPPLTPAHQEVYEKEYRINRGAEGGALYNLLQKLESWNHKAVAKLPNSGDILELGAGTLNHFSYESGYTHYDVVEPAEFLYKDHLEGKDIRTLYADITEVPQEQQYIKIFSVAVLEHLESLPEIVAQSALRLSDSGVFVNSIPSEGAFMWGMGWRFVTGTAYRLRTGLDYRTLIRHEHVNSAEEIHAVLSHFFADVRLSRFPTSSFHGSFYTSLEARNPHISTCEAYLASLA